MTTIARKPGRPKDEDLAERRHEEILAGAIRHFARASYHELDLDRLAGELGCAKGTVYRYFPTKQKLFEAAVDRAMTEMLEATRPDESIDPVDQLEGVWARALTFFDARPQYLELLIQERAVFRDRPKPSFFEYAETRMQQWRRKLRGLIRAGRVRPLPVDSILDFGGNLLYGAMFTGYFARKTKSLQQQAREIADIFLHGILTPSEWARCRVARPFTAASVAAAPPSMVPAMPPVHSRKRRCPATRLAARHTTRGTRASRDNHYE